MLIILTRGAGVPIPDIGFWGRKILSGILATLASLACYGPWATMVMVEARLEVFPTSLPIAFPTPGLSGRAVAGQSCLAGDKALIAQG